MKKTIILALIAMAVGVKAAGQSMFDNSTDLKVIAQEWDSQALRGVADGTLAAMLDRFDKQWPTWLLRSAVKTMKKGVTGRDTHEGEQIVVFNNPRNGFVQVDWTGEAPLHEFMKSCYWKRSNGHRLFAIYFGGVYDEYSTHFACFYDYDPQKHILTPEPQITEGFRETADTKYYYELPEEGKEMKILEFGPDGHIDYTFGWDGMKPMLKKTEKMKEDADGEHCDEDCGDEE